MDVFWVVGSLFSGGVNWNSRDECVAELLGIDNFLGVMGASNSNLFSPPDPNSYLDVLHLFDRAKFNGLASFSFNGMRSASSSAAFLGIGDVEGVVVSKSKPEKTVELVVSGVGGFLSLVFLIFVGVSS